jgi:hypothetical protein
MKWQHMVALRYLALLAGLCTVVSSPARAEALATVPVYSPIDITFSGPRQTARHVPARDIQLAVTFRHENGAPAFTVQGFFDGDGKGGVEGDTFKVRFCPTQTGTWHVTDVAAKAPELAGQHLGDTVVATPSALHGFWIPDDESAGRRWYRRSDGSHQYIFGNTHYTLLTEHGPDGELPGGNIAADMAGNAKYFTKVRFSVHSDRYPHPTEKPFLDDAGQPTDDGAFSHRPNPRWFHQRVDVAVRSAYQHDLIADLILAGPDTQESRRALKAERSGGDATPYLRYIAARYGSYPNVWLCLANEYDIKQPSYTQAEIARLGAAMRAMLPYPTPLSVHDGSRIGWSAQFDVLPEWADHQIIQRKIRSIAPAADALAFVWRGEDGKGPRRKPTVNDELSYEGAGDKHSEADTIAAYLGAFLGGGYGTTGEKYGNKLGQYFWGHFDPAQHTAADNLGWLRQLIDRDITFWKLAPDTSGEAFPDLDPRFRVMSWKDREYVLGTDAVSAGVVAQLPAGRWTIARHDVLAKQSEVIARDATGKVILEIPPSRAVLFHLKRTEVEQ